jgi:hypothetical protein
VCMCAGACVCLFPPGVWAGTGGAWTGDLDATGSSGHRGGRSTGLFPESGSSSTGSLASASDAHEIGVGEAVVLRVDLASRSASGLSFAWCVQWEGPEGGHWLCVPPLFPQSPPPPPPPHLSHTLPMQAHSTPPPDCWQP